jgi:anti-anti-sigma factor
VRQDAAVPVDNAPSGDDRDRPGTIDVVSDGPHWVARLAGEVDAAVVQSFADTDPTRGRQEAVVTAVEAAEVSFLDSSGLSLLLQWATRARRDGVSMRLLSASPAVRSLLLLSGTAELFAEAPAERPQGHGPDGER